MENELWKQVYQMVIRTGKGKTLKRAKFNDADIVITYLWSVMHDRPISWACNKRNWPIYYRRRVLPTPSTMTRRLRKSGVLSLLHKLEHALINMFPRSTCRWVDAKPLPVGGSSKDKQSAFGFGASCIAKGYKSYAVADNNQGFVSWTVRSINQSEHNVAAELIEELEHEGCLVGDGAYDKNQLYAMAAIKSIQLVTPQRIKKAKGLGHRRNHPYRIRAMSMNKRPFGQGLIESRTGIERMFGNLTTFIGCGLGALPYWVRTLFRAHLWVRGKMILYHIWRSQKHAQKIA